MENSLEAVHIALALLIFMLSVALIFSVQETYEKMTDFIYGNCRERVVYGGLNG